MNAITLGSGLLVTGFCIMLMGVAVLLAVHESTKRDGSYERPYCTIAEANRASANGQTGDIYVNANACGRSHV